MKQGRGFQWALLFALLTTFGCGGGGGGSSNTTTATIERVTTLAFMDVDGPKVQAIIVEYGVELPSGSVGLDTYEVFTYANLPQVFDVGTGNGGPDNNPYSTYPSFEIQNGIPGTPTKIYVSKTPDIDPAGQGDNAGKYVVIEVNTDYQLAAVGSDWRACVAGGIKQVKAINAGNISVSPSDDVYSNYEPGYFWDINPMGSNHSVTFQKVFDDTSYVLKGLEGYKIYTDNTTPEHEETHEAISDADRTVTYKVPDATVLSKVAEEGSFKVIGSGNCCYSEADGVKHDVSLMYSLFVPDDYEEQVAAGKKFALVLHFEDAGATGADPMIALTEAQAAANYASDRVQKLAKDQGLGGLIVVLPQIPKGGSGNTVADNLTGTEVVPATWKLLDHLTARYAIDMDHIYGSGQSMGGMQVLYMASMRDNYFAGIWAIGSQWGSNYNKELPYGNGPNSHSYFTYPFDGEIITSPDWQNWYYMISDDNILATNMTGDGTATGYWNQVVNLFDQFAGASFPKDEWDPVTTPKAEQSAKLQTLLAKPNDLGIYWNALSNGSHRATWIYAHAISYSYDWLLSQTRTSENLRPKLDLSGSYLDGKGTYLYNSTTQSAATP
jgi:predicted peptidase